MDVHHALWGIERDISELRNAGTFGWIVLSLFFGLPVASLIVLVLRSLLALLPLAISGSLCGLWFLYYATDWFSNPGQGAWMPAMFLVACGWFVLILALVHPWRRGPFRELFDFNALFREKPSR